MSENRSRGASTAVGIEEGLSSRRGFLASSAALLGGGAALAVLLKGGADPPRAPDGGGCPRGGGARRGGGALLAVLPKAAGAQDTGSIGCAESVEDIVTIAAVAEALAHTVHPHRAT